ncbi:Na(+)-translocating NADH-quinone reductase subunit E [Limihaloglobus sulfuriphilus]|uniref:Ion-translocating oxidoreductase complex subunit A n=1 Tax=Limihaloglobus sulfuriphilus TaxID=1851148 RepID=A0A1Q2MBM8_9BACT|nr:Rnf-Nqr domain containing protein [Limihaloglobus sulfuriphilus]AQQ69938.1 Na(+)-translocating NADH-quinone reductase subunit E [Limihaloglobus sulfuriphilus]
MNFGSEISQAFVVCISAIFTQNILLSYFLGLCPFIGVSREVKTSIGLGLAVIFVMTFTVMLNWLAYHYVLAPLNLHFFRFIMFIIIIAAFVQFIEMAIDRFSPVLYQNLGVFLPLITVNCAILGVSLFMVIRDYSFIVTIGYGLGSGIGWFLAIIAMAGIRQRLANERIPKGLQGAGITLIVAGIMALAFIGFTGVLQGQ